MLALRRVNALVLQRPAHAVAAGLLLFALALLGLLALFWQAAGTQAAGILLGGLLATTLVLGIAGWALAALVARGRGAAASPVMRC